MNGKRIIIKLNGTAIAASKSCDIQTSAETEELSNFGVSGDDNQWNRVIASKKSWSVTTDQLVLSPQAMSSGLLSVGRMYTLTIHDADAPSTALLSGTAICTKASIRARVGALATGSFSFKGSGPLS